MMGRAAIFFNVCIWLFILCCACQENSYEITNVPYHRQINRYSCGAASFEMIYHYFQQDLDQRAVIDVCRTSQHLGTRVFDMVRGAHFSSLSSAAAQQYFPEQAPTNGWSKNLPYGLAGFGYAGETCWLNEFKNIIAQGYPLVVLNYFSASDFSGHYRVAIGFDNETITFLDPWDRFWPRKIKITNEEFCNEIWNYPHQFHNETSPPFWAGFMAPWKINVSYSALNYSLSEYIENKEYNFVELEANLTYPCPEPFCGKGIPKQTRQYPAESTNVTISLPSNMEIIEGPQTVNHGILYAGESVSFRWTIKIDDSLDVKFNSVEPIDSNGINVTAVGLIHGSVPKTFCCYNGEGGKYYPPYSYSDILGAVGTVSY